jgi:plastocyanin
LTQFVSTPTLLFVGTVWFVHLGCTPMTEPIEERRNVPITATNVEGVIVKGLAPPVAGGFHSAILFEQDGPQAKPLSTATVTMDQRGLVFVPGLLVARVGQEVAFTNGDDVLHNVHVTNAATLETIFNVATPSKGAHLHIFESVGTYSVSCDVHPAMAAYILITEAEYAVVAQRGGQFISSDMPPGRYTVRVWNVDPKRRSVRKIDITKDAELNLVTPE